MGMLVFMDGAMIKFDILLLMFVITDCLNKVSMRFNMKLET